MSVLTAFDIRRSRWETAVLLAAAIALPREARAQAKACARTATGTWAVNGVVAAGQALGACSANANWSRVVPLSMTPASAPTGNVTATGQISFTRFNDHLFVGITVGEDQDFSDRDQVVLVFDKEADGTANTGDFFLRIDVAPATPITSDSNPAQVVCQFVTTVHYFAYDAGQGFFTEQATNVSSATVAKVAYDYDTSGDPETRLWNIEIDMPLNRNIDGTNFYPLKTAAPFFKMGAYVFVDQGHVQAPGGQTGNVLRWPQTLQERQISEWDQNAPAWVPTQLADIDLNDVCFNVTLAATLEPTPWTVNNAANPDGSAHLNPANQNNSFRVRFFYQGPGTSPAAGPNNGQVRVTVMPFNGSNFDPAWQPAPVPVALDSTNKHYTADFFAPANTFPSTMQWACSDMFLQNFTHDDNQTTADNHIHINHNYIHTSDFTQPIAISAAGIPGLAPGQTTNVVMNLAATNDPSKPRGAFGPFEIPRLRAPVLILFAVAVLALIAAATLRKRRPIAVALVGAAVIAIAAGCVKKGRTIGNGRWDIQNADSLGIEPIRDKPGWYRMPIRQGEIKTLNVHFGDAPLPYQTRVEQLQFHSDSAPHRIRVPVQPGRVVTVVATGLVDVDGKNGPTPAINPAGFTRQATIPVGIAARAAAPRYLLSPRYDQPAQNVGTLIGSFDDFKSSFVIGTNRSIAVPNGAQQLTIAINALPGDYRLGDGVYEVNIVDTPGPRVPTVTPVAFDTPIDQPWFLYPWVVLTAMNIQTFYEVPVKNPKTNTTLTGFSSLGESHVTVYRSSR